MVFVPVGRIGVNSLHELRATAQNGCLDDSRVDRLSQWGIAYYMLEDVALVVLRRRGEIKL